MKKRWIINMALVICIFAFISCTSENETSVKIGGLSHIGTKGKIEGISGDSGTWEIPGKYKVEILGVQLDDGSQYTEGRALKEFMGTKNLFVATEVMDITLKVSNIGYEPTAEDRKKDTISGSKILADYKVYDAKKKKEISG